MEEIKRQIFRAQKRMIFQQFLSIICWTMFAMFVVLCIALAVPKIWALPIEPNIWKWSWIGGSVAAAVLLAGGWTFLTRRVQIDAAIEIDQRFGLKERVASALSLEAKDLETEVGRALIRDTSRRVERIDVPDRFRITLGWQWLMPLLSVAAVLVILMLPNANKNSAQGHETTIAAKKQIKKSTEELRKKLEDERLKAEQKGLKEAEVLFDQLQSQLDKMNSKDKLDRKEVLIKLNDLKKEFEKRKKQLGSAKQMRSQLNQIKNIKKGPADKIAQAMKQGNFKNAIDLIQQLKDKLEAGKLSEQEKKELADQLEQLQKKLQDIVDRHEEAKRQLQEKIEQLEKEGKLAEAGKLQQKLDQMKMQDQQMNRMQQMANKIGNCQQCLKNGNGQQAANQLGDLAGQLQQMQQEFDNLEAIDAQTIDDLLAQIDGAKNALNCQQCQGAGCQACQGNGLGNEPQAGNGLGPGQGFGARPEEETDTGFFESQVRGNVRRGEAVIAGTAGGPNVKGMTQEEVKQQVSSSVKKVGDPIMNQKLSRGQREHAKQYFERFRQGSD